MPSWGATATELAALLGAGQATACDDLRRKYIAAVHHRTKRAVIVYSAKFTQPDPSIAEYVGITDEDMIGMMECVHGVKEKEVDFILHSPGGSVDAADAIGRYLRTKFDHIRIIVPHLALSAASMLSCVADEIMMGKHSFLGPIDPQFLLGTQIGVRWVAAQNILNQFDRAVAEDPKRLPAWVPMLGQFGPDLLQKCEDSSALVEEVAEGWLVRYMFKELAKEDRKATAKKVAGWLANRGNHFRSHDRHLDREELRREGMAVSDLENDQILQDAVLSVYHATTHTFNLSPAVKIIENHRCKTYAKVVRSGMIQPSDPVRPPTPEPPKKKKKK